MDNMERTNTHDKNAAVISTKSIDSSYDTSSPTQTLTDRDLITPSAITKADGMEKQAVNTSSPPLGNNGRPEHWLEKTEQKLPDNNLYIVFTGLMLVVFL